MASKNHNSLYIAHASIVYANSLILFNVAVLLTKLVHSLIIYINTLFISFIKCPQLEFVLIIIIVS